MTSWMDLGFVTMDPADLPGTRKWNQTLIVSSPKNFPHGNVNFVLCMATYSIGCGVGGTSVNLIHGVAISNKETFTGLVN